MNGENFPAEIAPILQSLLDGSNAAFALYDPSDRLYFANPVFRKALAIADGSSPTWEETMRHCHAQHCGLLIESADIDAWLACVSTKRRQTPTRSFESDLVDGRWLWMNETLRPDGWLLVVGSDITSVKKNEHLLRVAHSSALQAAFTDALTGIFNRRYIFAKLSELLDDSLASDSPFCLCALDLDYFKKINDLHGHPIGDVVLRHFTGQVRNHVRPTDVVGRIGGEEFLLLMPNTKLADAAGVIERLLEQVRSSRALPKRPSLVYTFSAGLCQARPGDKVEKIVSRADHALYAAKESGRNRLVIADDAA